MHRDVCILRVSPAHSQCARSPLPCCLLSIYDLLLLICSAWRVNVQFIPISPSPVPAFDQIALFSLSSFSYWHHLWHHLQLSLPPWHCQEFLSHVCPHMRILLLFYFICILNCFSHCSAFLPQSHLWILQQFLARPNSVSSLPIYGFFCFNLALQPFLA
jgi:hypothetical protein